MSIKCNSCSTWNTFSCRILKKSSKVFSTFQKRMNLKDKTCSGKFKLYSLRITLYRKVNPSDCVDMDCDGLKKALIKVFNIAFAIYIKRQVRTTKSFHYILVLLYN